MAMLNKAPTRPLPLRALAAAAAAASLALLAACGPGAQPPSGSPSSSASGDLGQFLDQAPEWGTCVDTATTAADAALFAHPDLECATVEVPIDYAEPQGDTGQIAMLRLPATGERQGSLLVNPGGPGGSGNNFVALLRERWQATAVAEHYDIVGFDPRGVGATTPRAECFTDKEYDEGAGFRIGAVYDITSADQAAAMAQRCVEGTGGTKALTSISTMNTVRDMDVMRAALGDEKLSFLGYSYGSELGELYAKTFPEKVRAVVIDGAIAPDLTATEFRLSQYVAIQASFDDLAATCAEAPDCVLGSDPASASDRFRAILEPLADDPAPTAAGRDVSVHDAYTAIVGALYAEAHWPDVLTALEEYEAGRADALLALRDRYFGRGADGAYGLDFDSNVATRCMDWPTLTPEETTALARDIADVAPIFDLDAFTRVHHHECEGWPERAEAEEPTAAAEIPPTLVVSVTGDPGTPHEGGVAMARELGGHLLTVHGKQHGAYLLGGSDCVDDAVESYLLDLETPPDGAECSLPS
ncbi:alpha/beta hydrolase [Promicromonospora sp. NPDC057488]|uniref:alpha/beta hydrolase n=1 Tax=Promicromonospora sp. NPDC057488 TaxID=3346147 RepID=UPI003671C471